MVEATQVFMNGAQGLATQGPEFKSQYDQEKKRKKKKKKGGCGPGWPGLKT
jgi:hypothetical protein